MKTLFTKNKRLFGKEVVTIAGKLKINKEGKVEIDEKNRDLFKKVVELVKRHPDFFIEGEKIEKQIKIVKPVKGDAEYWRDKYEECRKKMLACDCCEDSEGVKNLKNNENTKELKKEVSKAKQVENPKLTKKQLNELSLEELIEIAQKSEFPKKEWEKYKTNKNLMVNYIYGKLK